MAWKSSWWTKIKGADRVANQMRSFGVDQAIQRAYTVQHYAPGLANQPNLQSAVVSSGMDPATARRVDTAFSATAAQKQQGLLNDAGISPALQDPRLSRPAMAATQAAAPAPTAPGVIPAVGTVPVQDDGSGHGPAGNFFDWLGHGVSDFTKSFGQIVQARTAQHDAPANYGNWAQNLVTPGGDVSTVPAVGKPLKAVADTTFDVGKGAVDTIGTVGQAIISPISAPLAAGSAEGSEDIGNVGPLSTHNSGGSLVAQWARGVSRIFGDGVDDAQKDDMRLAGYDPDSWTDRYGWYADLHSRNGIINQHEVDRLRSDGKNPYKVDLAREIVASGVDDDFSKFGALSPDAQRMLGDIQANKDKEASSILQDLSANSTSLGSHVAYSFGLTPDQGGFTAVAALGDLAGYWYLDPLAAAGKATKAVRYARFGVDRSPEDVRNAIAATGTTISRRWDTVLDHVDQQHVLMNSPRVEDQAAAARNLDNFSKTHADVMPFYSTLMQMRQGSITGTVWRAPKEGAKFRDSADFRANTVGIERVADPAGYKPVFQLRENPGDEVAQETRDEARAEIANRLGDMIFAWNMQTGQPLVKGQMLLPGQLRLTGVAQRAIAPVVDKVLGQRGKLLDQLKDAEGKGVLDFDKASSARAATMHVVDSAKGGQWLQENYTHGGLRDRAAMTLSRFALTKDAPVIRLDDESSMTDIKNLVRFFAPKDHAAYVAAQWATADPAARSVMLNSLAEMAGNARGALDGKANVDFWRQALKGRESPILPGEKIKEAYSSQAVDQIDTPSGPVAAAMWSTQFADGVRLPSYVDILKNSEKVGVLSWLTGVSHSRWVNAFTRIQKVGQVGTTSNMMRQALEGRALQALDNPLGAVHGWQARMGLAGGNATERVSINAAHRQARALRRSDGVDKLTPLLAKKDFEAYADEAANILSKRGVTIDPVLDSALRQGANFDKIASHRSAARLVFNRATSDPLRRARAKLYSKYTEKYGDQFSYDWLDRAEEGLTSNLEDAVHNVLGGNRAHYMDGGLVDDLDQVDEGVRNGQQLAKLKLRNTQDYLGAAGDSGVLRWGNALGLRLADPVGQKLAPTVARIALGRTTEQAPEDLVSDLLTKMPEGERYRLSGRRAQYSDGEYVGGTEDQTAALKAWGEQMVDDLADYLGVTSDGARTGGRHAAHNAFLKKIADGKPITHEDLAAIPDNFRPEQVHAPVVVGKKFLDGPGKMTDKITDGASKMYQFVVANPLSRMVHEPQVAAAHHEVMVALEPVARSLKEKGLTNDTIYSMLEPVAYGHAINRVVRYSDNPHATSYFAALSNNFLWYERAMEDFARRAIKIAKADPAVVARAHLMWESAVHSGLVTPEVVVDDDGQQKKEYMFSWPGSGLAMRTINEAAQSLGLVDDDIIKQPVWQDLTSPVQWLSPSLQNPLGFTTTPLIGLPMRAVKTLFPETAPAVENVLSTMEGGERYFGSQSILESLLPVYGKRIYNMLDTSEQDSQLASATRNALIYYSAAGLLPPADAPAADRQRALDAVRQMVQNNLVARGIVASFLPATPGTMSSNIDGIGDDDLNVFDRQRGVNTIRSEWFQTLEDYNKKFPNDSNRAFSEAAADWAKRDMGSISDPVAFTVGSSRAPGSEDAGSFPSNMETTQWMLDNSSFLKKYGTVAYDLMPSLGHEYYNNVGYQTQLRTEVRQHKGLSEFYNDLVIGQANTAFYTALDVRNQMLDKARNPAEKTAAYDWFESYQDGLSRANPVWAEQLNKTSDPDYIAANVLPAVKGMAADPNLPDQVKPMQREFGVMASLYDEYREAVSTHSGTYYKDVQARKDITKAYNATGDNLFKSGPLDSVWKSMKVWMD